MIKIDKSRDKLFDELGLKRLRESYMRDEETSPQERFAYVSEKFGSNPEHAQRLYDYSSKHWLSYATPVLAYGKVKNGLPISCFTGDTWISVKSCGAKQIKDVCIGDEVLTHEGRWKPVINTRKSHSDNLYELKIDGRGTLIKVTGNHLLLTNFGWMRVDELTNKHLIATNSYYEDIEKEYIINDIFDHYITKEKINAGHYTSLELINNINVSNDLMWALGLWFAEGSVTRNGTVAITMNVNEIEYINKWKMIISNTFGVNNSGVASITNRKADTNGKGGKHSWANGALHSKILASWFDGNFGNGCKVKSIPKWILELPKEQLQHFCDGCYLGDGYKTTYTRMITMANPKIITQLYHIMLKLGNKNLSLNIQKKELKWLKREDKFNITSSLGLYHRDTGVEFHKHIFRKIKNIKKIDNFSDDVYDIMVKDDESFTVSGIIAHNCYLSYIHDSKEGLVDALYETNWLSMLGGGIGIGVDIRSADELSVGILPHLKVYDASTLAYKQGTRRGSFATYLNIDHPDIEMFIELRKETGDPRRRTPNLHHGVNITDDFMQIIEKCMIDPNYDDTWILKDPNGKIRGKTSAKLLWQKLLETRMEKGEPYFHFIDTANRALPKWLKDLDLKITQSNLCVSGDTIITILVENENIKDIKINELGNYLNKSLIKVYSYDIKEDKLEFKPITNFAMTNEKAKVMKITLENANFIICTPEHKIYTINRGYVLAKELLENDKLFCDF